MALYRAQKGKRQAAMFPNVLTVEPANAEVKPYMANVLFTHGDFFRDVRRAVRERRRVGPGPGRQERPRRRALEETAERLFGDTDAVGKTVNLGGEDFTVTGVMNDWRPSPRLYHTSAGSFGSTEEIFLPFGIGIERELQSSSNNNCWKDSGTGYQAWLASDCIWMDFWVELESESAHELQGVPRQLRRRPEEARPVRAAAQQPPQHRRRVARRGARGVARRAHPGWLAFAFLVVCLINTVGLLLAKFLARAGEIPGCAARSARASGKSSRNTSPRPAWSAWPVPPSACS